MHDMMEEIKTHVDGMKAYVDEMKAHAL